MLKRISMGLLFIAVLVGFLISPAMAAERASTMGVPNSSGEYAVQVDTDNVISFPAGQIKLNIETAVTNDTITAAESGTTYIVTPTSRTTFTLPTAEAGLVYTFAMSTGDLGSDLKVALNPADVDTFFGCINSTAISTFAAGDSVLSPGVTGDSITIVSPGTLYWYCTNTVGTWTDGG